LFSGRQRIPSFAIQLDDRFQGGCRCDIFPSEQYNGIAKEKKNVQSVRGQYTVLHAATMVQGCRFACAQPDDNLPLYAEFARSTTGDYLFVVCGSATTTTMFPASNSPVMKTLDIPDNLGSCILQSL